MRDFYLTDSVEKYAEWQTFQNDRIETKDKSILTFNP